jgi:hypothetical protein
MSKKADETKNERKRVKRTKPGPEMRAGEEEPEAGAVTKGLEEVEWEEEGSEGRLKEKDYRSRTALSRIRILKRILQQLEDKMAEEMGKTSLSDYIRLLQLVREMESEVHEKEIVVQWVQEPQADDDTGE